MPDMKELLGESYTPELESAIASAFVPKENAQGETNRLKDELKKTKSELDEIRKASLSAEEKAKLETERLLAETAAERAALGKERSKLALHTGLSGIGISLESHAETMDLLATSDSEQSQKIASGLKKLLDDAVSFGEAKANAQHLKNNGTPQGDAKSKTALQDAQNNLDAAIKSGDDAEIMKWTMTLHSLKQKE